MWLQELDEQHRPPDWQLKNCVRLCQIHIRRGINELVKANGLLRTGVYHRMNALLECESSEQYFELIELLRGKYL